MTMFLPVDGALLDGCNQHYETMLRHRQNLARLKLIWQVNTGLLIVIGNGCPHFAAKFARILARLFTKIVKNLNKSVIYKVY